MVQGRKVMLRMSRNGSIGRYDQTDRTAVSRPTMSNNRYSPTAHAITPISENRPQICFPQIEKQKKTRNHMRCSLDHAISKMRHSPTLEERYLVPITFNGDSAAGQRKSGYIKRTLNKSTIIQKIKPVLTSQT